MSRRRRLSELTGREGEEGHGPDDPLVVRTADLAAALRPWVDRFNREHDLSWNSVTEGPDARMPAGYGATQYLSHWTGVDQQNVRRILRADTTHTMLRVADKLLSAAGMSDMLHTTIEVVPNPRWSRARWELWQSRALNACSDLSADDASDV